jgi:hypothetical protein
MSSPRDIDIAAAIGAGRETRTGGKNTTRRQLRDRLARDLRVVSLGCELLVTAEFLLEKYEKANSSQT